MKFHQERKGCMGDDVKWGMPNWILIRLEWFGYGYKNIGYKIEEHVTDFHQIYERLEWLGYRFKQWIWNEEYAIEFHQI
jgi:hypothetical protein